MDILYLLVPVSVGLVLLILGVFGWAVHSGQLDELERCGEAIFEAPSDALIQVNTDAVARPNNLLADPEHGSWREPNA